MRRWRPFCGRCSSPSRSSCSSVTGRRVSRRTSSRRACTRSSSTSPTTSGSTAPIGSTCEIVDGVFTGVSLQPCYGPYKAAGRPPDRRPGRARPRGLDRVLGLVQRPRVPRSGGRSDRDQSRPQAPQDRGPPPLACPPFQDAGHAPIDLNGGRERQTAIFTNPVRPSHWSFIAAALDESHDPLDPAHQHPHRDPRLPAARDVRDPPALDGISGESTARQLPADACCAMNASTRSQASADASACSSNLRSKKLWGAPS